LSVKDCRGGEAVAIGNVVRKHGTPESLTRRRRVTPIYCKKLVKHLKGATASKASNIGEVCQFAAAGKEMGKKSLAEIAMSYGYVYVAQIALGANPAQALKAIQEAEAYNGPSLIIGYAPCELHGVKGGMNHCQDEMKAAVKAGYWNLFSFNPQLKAEGKNPFTLTSKEGDGSYQAFLNNETRYSALTRKFPDRAKVLFDRNEQAAKARFEHLQKLVELYK